MVAVDTCPNVGAWTRFSLTMHLEKYPRNVWCWALPVCIVCARWGGIKMDLARRLLKKGGNSPTLFFFLEELSKSFFAECKNKRGKILFSK